MAKEVSGSFPDTSFLNEALESHASQNNPNQDGTVQESVAFRQRDLAAHAVDQVDANKQDKIKNHHDGRCKRIWQSKLENHQFAQKKHASEEADEDQTMMVLVSEVHCDHVPFFARTSCN